MSLERLILPEGYHSTLDILETERAIKLLKDSFEQNLAQALNLTRGLAPLFVAAGERIKRDLNGVERPVQFDIRELNADVQIVHSLAKWKRLALKHYGFAPQTGLYTDMNAIRRDEDLDNLHSVYVDQWDWEKIITRESRSMSTLEETVRKIFGALVKTEELLCRTYPQIKSFVAPT